MNALDAVACTLITSGEASAALGRSVQGPQPGVPAEGGAPTCGFDSGDLSYGLSVEVFPDMSAADFDAGRWVTGFSCSHPGPCTSGPTGNVIPGSLTALPGIGDEALTFGPPVGDPKAPFATVAVRKGAKVAVITLNRGIGHPPALDATELLARTAAGRL